MALLGIEYLSSDEDCTPSSTRITTQDPNLQEVLAIPSDTSISYNESFADLSRPPAGPINPSQPGEMNSRKRKNVLTGHAEEAIFSEATFRIQRRTFESRGYALDPSANNDQITGDVVNAKRFQGGNVVQVRPSESESHAFKPKRQRKKGDPSIVEGEGAFRGPWAPFVNTDQGYEDETAGTGHELASDNEFVDESLAPMMASAMDKAATSYSEDVSNAEKTHFHGSKEFDYQGRSYMHVPQDLGINLNKEVGSIINFHPKKEIFKWKSSSNRINALRFFPTSGHLLLAASADAAIKLYSVYNERELLRSYSGHSKSVSDICFNESGTSFLSGSHDRKMVLWDTETGKAISRYKAGENPQNSSTPHVLKFHPDESSHEFLAGMSDNRIVQFDTRSGEKTQIYNHHLAPINSKPHLIFDV